MLRRMGGNESTAAASPGPAVRHPRRIGADGVALSVTAVLFMSATGLSSVALPLRALGAGHGPGIIGVLVGLAALVQIVVRTRLGGLMRRVPDRVVFAFAPVAQMMTFGILLLSASVVALALAWAFLAVARACFWTAGQTHAVRGQGRAMGAIARLNFFGTLGSLGGPVLAGLLADHGIRVALLAGGVLAATALLPTIALKRYPPFSRASQGPKQAMWRRPGVDAGCWAGVTSGAWRGLMDGYVPTVLAGFGYAATAIGSLVSVANGAAVLGTVIIGRLRRTWVPVTYVCSMLAAALGLAALGYAAVTVVLAGLALGLAGLGAGVLQTLGPDLAASAVLPDEKGDAMATYGAARTSAMFLAPLAMAGGIVILPIPVVLLAVGASLAAPAWAVRSVRRMAAGPAPDGAA